MFDSFLLIYLLIFYSFTAKRTYQLSIKLPYVKSDVVVSYFII